MANQTDKEKYLSALDAIGFTQYFCELVNGKRQLNCSYVISHPAWKKFLSNRLSESGSLNLEYFSSALDEYFWVVDNHSTEQDGDSIKQYESNHTFSDNEKILSSLGDQIKHSLKEGDQNGVFFAAVRILDWGQVYRGSLKWLINKKLDNTLIQSIQDALNILDGDSFNLLQRFDGKDLRMDSGTTKIFSLASKNSIIYDDRVGAGLGKLVVRYLEESLIPDLPADLEFMRSSNTDRNPSKGKYKFPTRGKSPSLIHAKSNIKANWLLEEVKNRTSWDIRKLEAALFMIGYRA